MKVEVSEGLAVVAEMAQEAMEAASMVGGREEE